MPIYEYRCENGHVFEVMQRMADDPVATCQTCEAPVQQVFHPIAVHFKGSGFYNTDYGTRKRSKEAEAVGGDGADTSDGKSGDEKKSGDKAATGASTNEKGGGSHGTDAKSASTSKDKQS
jgi:putative FmdB family regulatory protein